MKNIGLVSISFRKLTIEEIFELCSSNGLENIEWGSDVHCKPKDTEAINKINSLSEKYGIKTCAYGSYYRVGAENAGNADFKDIADTAKALNAPVIRVWAFNKGSAEVTSQEYEAVVADMRRICGIADAYGIKISLECHNNTLTDDYNSALKLLSDANCENLTMYWQPNQFKTLEYNFESAKALAPYVTNVHTFNWDKNLRFPLSDAIETWKKYADIIAVSKAHEHNYLLEFMPHDSPEEMSAECAALKKIFEELEL